MPFLAVIAAQAVRFYIPDITGLVFDNFGRYSCDNFRRIMMERYPFVLSSRSCHVRPVIPVNTSPDIDQEIVLLVQGDSRNIVRKSCAVT
jgi:hypothetical protein